MTRDTDGAAMSETTPGETPVDPAEWLRARGWTRYLGKAGEYWRRTPNEPGWEGGWNLGGAVHMELEADNRALLMRMGLYPPPAKKGTSDDRGDARGATAAGALSQTSTTTTTPTRMTSTPAVRRWPCCCAYCSR